MRFKRALVATFAVAQMTAAAAAQLSTKEVVVPVRHVDYAFAVSKSPNGVPTMDWDLFKSRPRKIITSQWDGIQIENSFFRATLIPSMGRIHSFINKSTEHEQLWINPCAKPIGAHNDTGFWVTWGGIERVLPSQEHGTTHALKWRHQVLADNEQWHLSKCSVREPITKIRFELYFAAYADKPYLETTIVLNGASRPQKFSHWTTTVLAPGGGDEVTPRTELIIPAERFVPDKRDFNGWMKPLVGTTDQSPLRFVENWKSIGDLMTSPVKEPYYAVYAHEHDEGIVHTFDLESAPTVDIWGWGYPATDKRQSEFTAAPPNQGYIEFWNGNVANFRNEALVEIASDETVGWTERTFCVQGLLAKADTSSLRAEISKAAAVVAPTMPVAVSPVDEPKPYRVESTLIATGGDKYSWFQSRPVFIPGGKSVDAKPFWLVTTQQLDKGMGHGYRDIYTCRTLDGGKSWTTPARVATLGRTKQSDGYDLAAGDLWPLYHRPTDRVLATGKTFNFRDGAHENILREQVSYAVFDPRSNEWSDLKIMAMPKKDATGQPIIAPNAGCNQTVIAPNGDILIPVRYQRSNDWRNYVTTVARCRFDGAELKYLSHGSELSNPIGRGLYEPSIAKNRDTYFLTMRADHDGFVSRSADGVHFSEPVAWRYDDGKRLGSYNTQQHWISRPEALYLVYTRRAENNRHVFRQRAPLYIAQVDRASLRVIRSTEKVLVPENGRALGNFGICNAENETWVVTSEGAPSAGVDWRSNRVTLAKIIWEELAP